jgi:Protein of unknown function, DUF547
VFSLSELEQCVIRGKLARSKSQPRHFPPQIPLTDDHYAYSLTLVDQRINFILNQGSVSSPECIFLLTPENLSGQFTKASKMALMHSISVDFGWRIVTLPKVCEIYRGDFGEDAVTILQHCLTYVDKTGVGADITSLMEGESKPPQVKFLKFAYETYKKMKLVG